MRRFFDDYREEREHTVQWSSIAYMFMAILIIFIILFAVGSPPGSMTPAQADSDSSVIDDKAAGESGRTDLLEEKDTEAAKAESNMAKREEQMKKLLEVRGRIVGELVEKFSEMNLNIDIDKKTGGIRFSEALYFDVNAQTLNESGKQYLDRFLPAYLSVLMSENNKEYVDQIIIEGHADSYGSYLYNLDLSQKRAYEVASYIFSKSLPALPDNLKVPETLFAVSGRSYGDLVMDGERVDRQKTRRVEFRFRLKDEDIAEGLLKLLEGGE